jgi:hypothetical protein
MSLSAGLCKRDDVLVKLELRARPLASASLSGVDPDETASGPDTTESVRREPRADASPRAGVPIRSTELDERLRSRREAINASSNTARCSSKGAAPLGSDEADAPGGGGGGRGSAGGACLGDMLTARMMSSGFTTDASRERVIIFKSRELSVGKRAWPYDDSGVRGGGTLSDGKTGGVGKRAAA